MRENTRRPRSLQYGRAVNIHYFRADTQDNIQGYRFISISYDVPVPAHPQPAFPPATPQRATLFSLHNRLCLIFRPPHHQGSHSAGTSALDLLPTPPISYIETSNISQKNEIFIFLPIFRGIYLGAQCPFLTSTDPLPHPTPTNLCLGHAL